MSSRFDVIVVGGGAMGTAAARSLVARGRQTLLLERFTFGHANGSSGGPTRIFRLTYHDPEYVRMARHALESWKELEDAAGEALMINTAGLDVGVGGRTSAAALAAAGERCAYLSAEAVSERWPVLRFGADAEIFVQEDGGVCRAEQTVRVQARLAAQLGATVREGTVVDELRPSHDGVEVITSDGAVFRAPVAVVTAGPWAAALLGTAGTTVPLVPSLEQVTYFELDEPAALPTIIDWEADPAHSPYWVPDPMEPGAFKIALHMSGPPVGADERTFEPDPVRVQVVEAYAATHVSRYRATGRTDTCLYTNTPDEDFVIDRVGPIVIGSPCSGHGFKFVPFVGEQLARLAVGETPEVDLHRFAASRSALSSD
ncbi:MAG: FAD-dependent oxidoreductase [Actinomycetota bacterium]